MKADADGQALERGVADSAEWVDGYNLAGWG